MMNARIPLRTACPFFFFFNDTATTEIYTLSLHDALPISRPVRSLSGANVGLSAAQRARPVVRPAGAVRSEEHTSELQSQSNLVCRLLLEKKKNERRHDGLRVSAPHVVRPSELRCGVAPLL